MSAVRRSRPLTPREQRQRPASAYAPPSPEISFPLSPRRGGGGTLQPADRRSSAPPPPFAGQELPSLRSPRSSLSLSSVPSSSPTSTLLSANHNRAATAALRRRKSHQPGQQIAPLCRPARAQFSMRPCARSKRHRGAMRFHDKARLELKTHSAPCPSVPTRLRCLFRRWGQAQYRDMLRSRSHAQRSRSVFCLSPGLLPKSTMMAFQLVEQARRQPNRRAVPAGRSEPCSRAYQTLCPPPSPTAALQTLRAREARRSGGGTLRCESELRLEAGLAGLPDSPVGPSASLALFPESLRCPAGGSYRSRHRPEKRS